MRPALCSRLVLIFVLSCPGPMTVSLAGDGLARADAAWQRRAEGSSGGRAAAGPAAAAVAAYRAAVAESPGELEPRVKLLRALYFQGELATTEQDRAARQRIFESGRRLAEESLDLLAGGAGRRDRLDRAIGQAGEGRAQAVEELLGEVPEAAALLFWSAVNWGMWGETVGRLKAARQGVGGRIRDYAAAVVALDERYEGAGGHRLLGRLHAVAPKIPLFTGWVDRDEAVRRLTRAVELAPEEPYNAFYLAEALLEHRPGERARAAALLTELAGRSPRPTHRVEDARVLAQAKKRLAER